MTQEELAQRVGTTGAVISLLEGGHRPLSDKWLRKLAPVLGTRAGHLLDYHPEDISGDIVEAMAEVPAARREEAAQVLRMFKPKEK